jgi:hypothetical protein
MIKLFICHASEDKDDFARPLVDALRKHFEVWFDEYSVKLGDPLLQKIDEGLATCDFGVVVLSKAFFGYSKKWTRAELDGLFARETPARKIILPVWKEISAEEIAKFSPIIADRVAVKASAGIERVVEEIRIAVDTAQRARQFNALDTVIEDARALDQDLHEQRQALELLNSKKGVDLVWTAFDNLFHIFQSALSPLNQTSKEMKFQVAKSFDNEVYVSTRWGLSLRLHLSGSPHAISPTVSAHNTVLEATLFRERLKGFARERPETLLINKFKPSFRAGTEVIWVSSSGEGKDGRKLRTNEELTALLTGELINYARTYSQQGNDT